MSPQDRRARPAHGRARRRRLLIAAFGLLIAGPGVLAPSGRPLAAGPADDAYHFSEWADGHHDATYTEWWYFNLIDASRNLQAVFTYFVIDPANLTGQGLAQIAAVAYAPPGVVSAVDVYAPAQFSASSQAADVRIESSAIEALDATTYRVAGATRNGRLSWDLTYTQEAVPWVAADRVTVGRHPWEQMSWLVYMPRASVSGRVTVDGQDHPVAGTGYHDHNWGEWVFTSALWNWAQYSAPGLSFELGDFAGQPTGMASLDLEGTRAMFTKQQYRLVHTRWAFDGHDRRPYPVESFFFAESDAARVSLWLRAISTEPLRGDVPAPLPVPIIYEQTARYEGWVQRKGPVGAWLPAVPVDGLGFKEYTTRTWHRPGPGAPGGATPR